jgi:hypothetical protein
MAKTKRAVRVPSTLQVCIPVETYDALEQLAQFEGSTLSQIARRAITLHLVQAGLVRPPQPKAANQQQAV